MRSGGRAGPPADSSDSLVTAARERGAQHVVQLGVRARAGVDVAEEELAPLEDEGAALLQSLVGPRRQDGLPPRRGARDVAERAVARPDAVGRVRL